MALGITGHGGFISQPLAIVVIGGLVSSTVLTLLVLPTLYNLVEGARERRVAKRAAKAGDGPDASSGSGRADAPGPWGGPSGRCGGGDAGRRVGARRRPAGSCRRSGLRCRPDVRRRNSGSPGSGSGGACSVREAPPNRPTSTTKLAAVAAAYLDDAPMPAHHLTRRELREHDLTIAEQAD